MVVNRGKTYNDELAKMKSESELERRLCRIIDQLRPLRRPQLFLDRPDDLNASVFCPRRKHAAVLEQWRMMSMVER